MAWGSEVKVVERFQDIEPDERYSREVDRIGQVLIFSSANYLHIHFTEVSIKNLDCGSDERAQKKSDCKVR